jgi:hypothetical protein
MILQTVKIPTLRWKSGDKKTFSTLFPHREKMQISIFNRFSTKKMHYSA